MFGKKKQGVSTLKHEVENIQTIFRHKIDFDRPQLRIVVQWRSVEKLAGRSFLALRGVVSPRDDGDHSDGLGTGPLTSNSPEPKKLSIAMQTFLQPDERNDPD